MQTLNRVQPKKKLAPKGARLNWTPLVKVESISLHGKTIIGKMITVNVTVKKSKGNSNKPNFLIP